MSPRISLQNGARVAAVLALSVFCVSPVNSQGGKAERIDFTQDIRPILSDKCFHCHGPDSSSRKGNLRLDRRKDAVAALSPSAPEKSEVLKRINHPSAAERMPPPDSKRQLSRRERETLRAWIEQGATYTEHWSFASIQRPTAPAMGSWGHNEIDAHIAESLRRRGLQHAAEASREQLIRRVTFDITGLPPTIAEVDAFLTDTGPGAYERLVDQLLSRQAYGERMAADWLDVARYSDSYGYQVDRNRFVWPWRDWVIKSFNNNQPYNEFILDQLAGDLRPNPTDDQLIATTFNRLHSQKVEGGSVPEEFRVEYVADRTHTFGTAFLGLTLECARCHDHKYDPISQKEYYQLFAFFNSIDEAGLYSYFTSSVPTPTLLLQDTAAKNQLAEAQKRITQAESQLRSVAESRKAAFETWRKGLPKSAEVTGRVAFQNFEEFKSGANKKVPGRFGNAVRLSGDDGFGISAGNFKRYEPFSVALWMKTPEAKERAVVFHRSRAWTDAGSRGYQLLLEGDRLSASLIHFWPGNAIRIKTRASIPINEWVHVAITYDGSSRAHGLKIFLDGAEASSEIVRDNLYKNITGGGGDNITIGQRFRDRGFTGGEVDEFQVFNRQLTALEIAQLPSGDPKFEVKQIAGSPGDQAKLFDFYLHTADKTYAEALESLKKAREARSRAVDPAREIMIMRELTPRRTTFVLNRGQYDMRREPVEPQTPEALPPLPGDAPRNRLGLARWLTSPEHPLTARVTVNRLWQLFFGQGLVSTPEDFGSQGQLPSHPELLDWLSRDFIENGWNVKRLVRQMVTSATYRQRSQASESLLERDPQNRWLANVTRRISCSRLASAACCNPLRRRLSAM